VKIYVSADMEGTAGVCSWFQCDPKDTADYPLFRRYMTLEVRAALDGARDGGASAFVVNDSHSTMRNLLLDELPDDARVIFGYRKPFSMTEGIDESFDGIFFTGYHAAVGTRNGVLAHTYSPETIYEVRINGEPCSEAMLNAGLAGLCGVPVLLVTGDRTTVEQVRTVMPWVVGVAVKEAVGYYATDSLTPAAARAAIREGAREAVLRRSEARPFVFETPVRMEITTLRTESADFMELIPGFERTGGRTVRFVHDDYGVVFRAFLAAMRLGNAANQEA